LITTIPKSPLFLIHNFKYKYKNENSKISNYDTVTTGQKFLEYNKYFKLIKIEMEDSAGEK
jgi:hypothetical protein